MTNYTVTPNVRRWIRDDIGLDPDTLDADALQRAVIEYADAMGAPLETITTRLGPRTWHMIADSGLADHADRHGYGPAGNTLHTKVTGSRPGRPYSLTVDEAEILATYAETTLICALDARHGEESWTDDYRDLTAEIKAMRTVLARLEAEGVYPL